MIKRGTIRRKETGEEEYFQGWTWKLFPSQLIYEGETKFLSMSPYRIKFHWESKTVYLIARVGNSEFLCLKKKVKDSWLKENVFIFRLYKNVYLFIGSAVYLLTISQPIQKVECQKNFQHLVRTAIYTQDRVFLFDRQWTKICRTKLEQAYSLVDIKDPFFILDELPYKLKFFHFAPQKLVFRWGWWEKLICKSLPLFHRNPYISSSSFPLNPSYWVKYFEFGKHLPSYSLDWIRQHFQEKYKHHWSTIFLDARMRHFLFFYQKDMIGYLMMEEKRKEGGTMFQIRYFILPPVWKKEWELKVYCFLSRHFLHPSLNWNLVRKLLKPNDNFQS